MPRRRRRGTYPGFRIARSAFHPTRFSAEHVPILRDSHTPRWTRRRLFPRPSAAGGKQPVEIAKLIMWRWRPDATSRSEAGPPHTSTLPVPEDASDTSSRGRDRLRSAAGRRVGPEPVGLVCRPRGLLWTSWKPRRPDVRGGAGEGEDGGGAGGGASGRAETAAKGWSRFLRPGRRRLADATWCQGQGRVPQAAS